MKKNVIVVILFLFSAWQVSFAQWEECNNGLTSRYISCMTAEGDLIIAASYEKGLFFSTDKGDNWDSVPVGENISLVYAIARSGDDIYAGSKDCILFSSNDKGKNWKKSTFNCFYIDAIAIKGDSVFIACDGDHGIVMSTDKGSNWTVANNGLTNHNVWSLLIDGDNIYAGTNSGVFLSTDGGFSWTAKNYGLLNCRVMSLAKTGNCVFAGVDDKGIMLSTDNGDNWKSVNNNILFLNNCSILSLVAFGNNVIASIRGRSIYLSTDLGGNWKQIRDGLPTVNMSKITLNNEYIYAHTANAVNDGYLNGGVFRAKLSDFELASVPDNYTQNDFSIMPNPAKEKISIKYPFNSSTLSTINITNELGMIVLRKDLYPGALNEVIEINTENFSTGSYFCTIISGNKIETRKFCVIN